MMETIKHVFPSSEKSSRTLLEQAILRLKELNINFIGIDFDCTLIDIHTGGRWQHSLDELKPHVRREFAQLLPACLENDIYVAIVTFSCQRELVTGVLEHVLGSAERAATVPIRTGMTVPHAVYAGRGVRHGKQAHLASAVEELEQKDHIRITKATTLLLDDDYRNTKAALADGTRALWFNPAKPHHMLQQIVKLV